MKLSQLLYLPWWYFQVKFLGKKKPLQTVIFISNVCNYECKHCCVDKSSLSTMSYEEVKSHLLYSFKQGSRFVDFEGGEPTLWRDGEKTVNDLCDLAKDIGFFSTTVTTNASEDFSWLNAEHVFVSLDGIKSHDEIRSEGAFKRLETNIAKYRTPSTLSVNMVINSINKEEVIETLEYAEKSPYINGISFNFYNQVGDNTFLKVTEKQTIIDTLLDYKERNYNIINTKRGLKSLANPNYPKVCWITNFITVEENHFLGCPSVNSEICNDCGLGMAGEMSALYNFSLDTIFSGLKLRKN